MASPAQSHVSPSKLSNANIKKTGILDPSVTDRAEELTREFATAQPFRHVVMESFLDAAVCQALMTEFPVFSKERALNETGQVGGKAVVPNLQKIGPAFASFDRLMQDAGFLALMSRITGIPNLLYDREYVGGGTHENLNGQELDTHVDFNYHPRTQWHRRLNLILFLNREWQDSWGGRLELMRDPFQEGVAASAVNALADLKDDIKIITPLANRCVVFETTEASWHGFRRIQLPSSAKGDITRKSIAVYFYTKEAPPSGGAPSHGTFYFQRPLPENIRPGHSMSEEDIREIQLLLARRDHQIRFLYEREKEFSEVIAHSAKSRALRLGKAILKPAVLLRDAFKGKKK